MTPRAATVTAIVENKETRAGLEQSRAMVQPMTDVPGVAVAQQVNIAPA